MVPDRLNKGINGLSQKSAARGRFSTVLGQKLIEKDHVGSHVLDMTALRLERAIRGSNEKTKHKRGHSADKSGAEANDIFCIIRQMMLRQNPPEHHPAKPAADNDRERCKRCK